MCPLYSDQVHLFIAYPAVQGMGRIQEVPQKSVVCVEMSPNRCILEDCPVILAKLSSEDLFKIRLTKDSHVLTTKNAP